MSTSPIKYTSRTYSQIINDINSDVDLIDKPEFFKRLIAGLGDMIAMINNASANQGYLDTAFTRQAVKDHLELIDYNLASQTTSNGILIFHMPSTVGFPVVYVVNDLKARSLGNSVLSSKDFEARAGDTIAAVTDTVVWDTGDSLTTIADIEYTAHKVRFTTTNTLPAPLAINTDYYIIRNSGTNIDVASSIANAYLETYIAITDAGIGVHTMNFYSFSIAAYQQKTISEQTIGETDGLTKWQEIDLPDTLVLDDTLSVRVGANAYTLVDTFVDYGSTDKIYKIIPKDEGEFAIRFGNGTYGILPPAGTVYAKYAVGGEVESNISNLNNITIYSGGNADISAVTNPTTFTGGDDEESLVSAKRLAPLLLKARNRFITAEDGEVLIETYGGIAYAKINKNAYGLLTVQALGIASGGGNPSGALKTALETYLEARTPLKEIDVTFDDTTLTTVIVTSATHVSSGYAWAGISAYVALAWKLFFTETGKEISEYYESNGIVGTITIINTIFTTTFTYAAHGTALIRLLDQFLLIGYRQIGDDIQESDAFAFVQAGVAGVDYITITLPAFPIALGDAECTTATGSTFNLTEV